ncbi:hypothetical protein BD311DRAFT_299936 [Dichomitus squalens]|uniref:Uncharacterized protein n=1 Tax=Dichomitus squalens TaxID=114155 RepID=A0A4Q9MRQ4_9APHY|nr:hypothetical protein BD311DRAFT_299936 [Dichomitus squalens]
MAEAETMSARFAFLGLARYSGLSRAVRLTEAISWNECCSSDGRVYLPGWQPQGSLSTILLPRNCVCIVIWLTSRSLPVSFICVGCPSAPSVRTLLSPVGICCVGRTAPAGWRGTKLHRLVTLSFSLVLQDILMATRISEWSSVSCQADPPKRPQAEVGTYPCVMFR